MAPKKQAQKLSLGEFLGDQTLGSWADEMEDMPVASGKSFSGSYDNKTKLNEDSRTGYGGGERRAFSSQPSFGGAERTPFAGGDRPFSVREQLPLPTKPPYTAHLGNLPFDATNADIEDFFSGCEVTSVRIVEDKMDRKPKGFGYVEFGSLDGLKTALDRNQAQFQGRNLRVTVAEPPKDRGEQREFNDWTRKGPLPDLPRTERRVSDNRGAGGGYEAAPGMERGGSRRGLGGESDGKVRDFGNWERKGPLSPVPGAAPAGREGGRPRGGGDTRERRASPAWGEGQSRSQEGSRPPRGEFRERPQYERQATAAELDNKWRTKMRPDAPEQSGTPTPEQSTPSSPAQPAPPTVRPRLNLAKRTVSQAEPSPSAASSDAKASPFGAARPIDTAAREKEVEEKRVLAIRQKQEAEEKAREEKKAKEVAEKSEKAAKADSSTEVTSEDGKAAGGKKENGDATRPGYQILAREEGENGDKEGIDASANGEIVDDKAVKPKEFIRDPPRGPKNEPRGGGNNWRQPRKPSTPNTPASPKVGSTTDGLEEDGWSTVPAASKRGKGRGGARAIAS